MFLHPMTVNFEKKELDSRYGVYHEVVKTSKVTFMSGETGSAFAAYRAILKLHRVFFLPFVSCHLNSWADIMDDRNGTGAIPANESKYTPHVTSMGITVCKVRIRSRHPPLAFALAFTGVCPGHDNGYTAHARALRWVSSGPSRETGKNGIHSSRVSPCVS